MKVGSTLVHVAICLAALGAGIAEGAAPASTGLPGPDRFWKVNEGLHANIDSSCGLHIKGTDSGGWNVARGVIDRLPEAETGRRRLVVPIIVDSLSDKRYWPRLIVQVVGGPAKVSTRRGTQYSPYRRESEPRQNLYVDIREPDFDRIEVLLSKETQAPLSVDLCVGTPYFERVSGDSPSSAGLVRRNAPGLPAAGASLDAKLLRSSPLFQKFLSDKKTACKRIPTSRQPSVTDQIRYDADLLEDASFAYAVTGGTDYLSCALRVAQKVHGTWRELPELDLPHAHVLRAFTFADEWLGSSIPNLHRMDMANDIAALVHLIQDALDDPATWWQDQYASNYKHAFTSAMGIACQRYDLAGLPDCRQRAFDEMALVLKAMPDDGSSLEGPGYWNYSLVWIIDYLRSLDDQQRRSLIAASRFLRNASHYRLHVSVPGFKYVIPYGDTDPGEYRRAATALRGLSAIQDDATAANLAKRITEARWPEVDVTWRDIVWTTRSTMPDAITEEPTYAYLPDQGIVVWRSSWTDKRAELVMFKAGALQGERLLRIGAIYGGHNHPDQGEVLLYSSGQWILRDDGYALHKSTSSHNSMLFSGRGQLGEGTPWFNAGEITQATLPQLRLSKLASDGFSVAAAIESAYPVDAHVARWTRQVSMERGRPLEIVDTVTMAERGSAVWLYHSDGNVTMTKAGPCIDGRWQMTSELQLGKGALLQWSVDGPTARGSLDLGADISAVVSTTLDELSTGCGALTGAAH